MRDVTHPQLGQAWDGDNEQIEIVWQFSDIVDEGTPQRLTRFLARMLVDIERSNPIPLVVNDLHEEAGGIPEARR